MLRHDLTPRPGYVALAAVGRFLAGAQCLGRLSPTVYAFRAKPDGEPRDVPVEVIEAEESSAGGAPTVIENDNIPAKPLTVEDAILQLELTHAEFLVFLNAATESVSVVYKRRDGNYGLITPNV